MGVERLEGQACSGCGVSGSVVRFSRREAEVVRGLSVDVTKVLRRCNSCGAEFENTRDPDWRPDAYRQYREMKGMVPPRTMVEWREEFGLKQADVTALLGWGEVTLGRYEKGALQSDANDRQLSELIEPSRLADALAAKPDAVPVERRRTILRKIREKLGLLVPEELRVIRAKYGLDQEIMSRMISVPPATWAAWEAGDGAQSPMSDSYLRVLAKRPDIVRELLESLHILPVPTKRLLETLEADTDRKVAEHTGMPVADVQRVEEEYRRAMPEAAEQLARVA